MPTIVKVWIIEGICLGVLIASSIELYVSGSVMFDYYINGAIQ